VEEYLALSPWRRFFYRLPRHPLIANVLLPPLIFLLLYRVPFDTPRTWVRERWSVHATNLALLCLFGTLALLLGWRQVLMVHLPALLRRWPGGGVPDPVGRGTRPPGELSRGHRAGARPVGPAGRQGVGVHDAWLDAISRRLARQRLARLRRRADGPRRLRHRR